MYAIAMSLGGSHTARQTGTIWAMSLRAKTPPTSVELVWLPLEPGPAFQWGAADSYSGSLETKPEQVPWRRPPQ